VRRGDPVESLNPPSWVLRRLKTLGVETVGDLLRLPLSELSTEPGSGTKAIEALIKKARQAVSVANEGRTDSSSPGLDLGDPSEHTVRVSEHSVGSKATIETETDSQCQLDEMRAILDRPWDELLVLPGFVTNGLHRAGLKTLREVIVASQGSTLLTVRGFGGHALRSLRWAIRRLKPQLISLCLGQLPSPTSSSTIHAYAIGHTSGFVKKLLSPEDSIDHLNLSSLEIRILARLGVKTVKDLLCLEPSALETLPGIGVKKIRVIGTLIKEVRKAVSIDVEDEGTISNNVKAFLESEVSLVNPCEPSEEMATIMDQPWDACLELSIRTVNGLRKAKVKTLREAIIASQDSELLKLRNFGKHSLDDLRRAIGKLGLRLTSMKPVEESTIALRQRLEWLGVAEQPCGVLGEEFSAKLRLIEKQHGPQTLGSLAELLTLLPHSRGVGRQTCARIAQALEVIASSDLGSLAKRSQECTMTLHQRLEQLGVTEQPCSVLGGQLSAKLRLIEKQHGPQTLGSLAELLALRPESQGVGRQTWAKIAEVLETVADLGLERYLYGENAPSNISALVACVLETVSEVDREILTYRLIDRFTLEEIGQRRSVSRERIRQKVESLLDALRKRFGNIARYLCTPLVSGMTDTGGLLHCETVYALTRETNLRRVQFGLLIAGEDTYRVWREEFLTSLARDELDRRLEALREALRARGKIDISIADMQDLAAQNAGFRLDVTSLSRLLATVWGLKAPADGRVAVGQLMTASDRFAAVLQSAGRPMHLKEIADVYRSQDSGDISAESFIEDDEPTVEIDPSSRRSLIEHSVEGALSRHKDVLRCGRGTFVHITALPFSQERLNEIVEWCVRRIEGEPGAISTQFLLRELKAAGLEEGGLNRFILKDALSSHPDIIGLRKHLVGHSGSFRENGLTLRDRVEAVLRHADRPLSLADILQRLPEGIEYFHVSVQQCLFRADFALNIGNGRFCHITSLGCSLLERENIVEQAVRLLPEDGTPVTLDSLLDQLIIKVPEIRLLGGDKGRDVLWSIIRKDERVECGRGYFLALKSGEKSGNLLDSMIIDVLKDMVVAFPRDVRREMANRYGYIRADNTAYASLTHCVEKGLVRRLPQSLYCLPSVSDSLLMNALRFHDGIIRKILEESNLSDYPIDDLSLLGRYFYQQAYFDGSQRVIETLLSRADLSEEQRSSSKRLWMIIRQKQEEA